MDVTKAAIGELALMPIIIGLVQAIKRFWPEGTSEVWFGLSFLFGVVGEVVVFLIAHPAPLEDWDLATWALCTVTGLAFGLARMVISNQSVRKCRAVRILATW